MADRMTLDEALREALKSRTVTYRLETCRVYDDYRPEDVTWRWDGQPVNFRDPIFTPIFTAVLGAGGIGLSGAPLTIAVSVASAIATTALTIGLQYAMAPKPPKAEQIGRQPLTQAIPYRFWGVGGPVRGAGAYMLWEAKDDKMISVQAMIAHKINAYTQIYLNDDRVGFESNGYSVTPIGNRYAESGVDVYKRLGAVPETAMTAIVNLLGAEGIWTNNHRGDGQASLGMICRAPNQQNFSKRFPNGRPVLTAAMELALVWDFRNPAQSPEDPSTWTFSRNSALILCWHECFNPFGTRRDFRKAILPVLDMWKEEADVCDEDVARASGGTEKRYECGGIDTTENDPKAGTNAILASCDGWICERGDGALLFVAGKFREKYVATLTDADIVGYVLQRDVLPEEEINRLIPRFNYPATDFTTTDTDYFEDAAAQVIAGRVLPKEMNLDWVLQWRQARRLGKREWVRIQQKKRGSLDLRLTGINAVYAPWVRLVTPKMLPALNGKVIANKKSTLALMKGGFQMVFTKMPDTPSDIDAWTPASDEGAAPPVPGKPNNDGIPSASIDSISVIASAGSVYLRVAVADNDRADLGLIVAYRTKDVGSGAGKWVQQRFPDAVQDDTDTPGDGLILVDTNPVPNDKVLQVRAAFTGADGSIGNWSSIVEVTATVDSTSPGALSGVSVTGGQMGRSTIVFTAPVTTNVKTVAIYRTVNGVALNRATNLIARIAVGPGQAVAYTDGDGTITNMLANGDFSTSGTWTLTTGWTIGSGVLTHAAGSNTHATQPATIVSGTVYRNGILVTSYTAGSFYMAFTGSTSQLGALWNSVGQKLGRRTAVAGTLTTLAMVPNGTDGVFSLDNAVLFAETPSCAPQGYFDYYIEAENGSGVRGTTSAATNVMII